MFACSVQIISRLGIQSKVQMFTLFDGSDVGVQNWRYKTWQLHIGLFKFVQNILTNI